MKSENQNSGNSTACENKSRIYPFLKVVLKGGFLAALVVAFMLSIAWTGQRANILNPWKQAMASYKLSDLYLGAHRSSRPVSYDGASVVTVDISNCYSRMEIAELINKINLAKPRAVALDVIFPDLSSNSNKADNDSLVAALQRTENLILVREYRPISRTEFAIQSSFFENDVDATVAAATLPMGVIREWSPMLVFDNDTVPSFAKAVADVVGIVVASTTDSQIIDYSIQDNITIKANEPWNPEFLENQIVLIGDLADVRDTHIIPLTLNRSIKQPGVCVHRQIIQTAMQGRVFHQVPNWLVLVVTYIILWVLCVVKKYWRHHTDKRFERINDSKGRFAVYLTAFWDGTKQDVLRLVILCFTICCGYLLFWTTGVLFEFKLLLSGYVLLYIFEGIDDRISRIKLEVKERLETEEE
ncbi:MAG: CHASE2 domain-containing protein [Alistipes sp.]|nr:CHASE2 domain-containing protein [Alistipes sp.]